MALSPDNEHSVPHGHTLYLAVAGLSDQDRLALTTAIKLLAHDGKPFELLEAQPRRAHLLVLDADHREGREALAAARPGQVKLLLAAEARIGRNLIAVRKPVDIGRFRDLLGRLYEKMAAQLSHRDAPARPATATPVDVFRTLLDARNQRRRLVLEVAGTGSAWIDGEAGSVTSTLDTAALHRLLTRPAGAFTVREPAPGEQAPAGDIQVTSLSTLLWDAALACSGGRLLPGHDTETPVRLKAWPNFTRHAFHPDHLKLAAALARAPHTLAGLAAVTGVPLATAIDFHNAAFAVGLLERAGDDTPAVPPPAPPSPRRGLLARIARRLSLRR